MGSNSKSFNNIHYEEFEIFECTTTTSKIRTLKTLLK